MSRLSPPPLPPPRPIDDSSVVIRASKQKSIKPRGSVDMLPTFKDNPHLRRRDRRNSSVIKALEEPTEVFILNSVRQVMIDLLSELRRVIKLNDAAPNVQSSLRPLVKSVERTFPSFHTKAVRYYTRYDEIRKTAKQAHVLSSAGVGPALQAFLKGWTGLEKLIDKYADTHPPPHAGEITTKFKSVKSSLEGIMQTNVNRKFPNIGLNKCVLSLQSLCDSLTDSIVELLMQPEFPDFKTDALKVYKADVKGFAKVVNEAFYNEFPQSGVSLCDLARIKLNVNASIDDIIAGLEAAFSFLPMMKHVKALKDTYERDSRPLIDVLSQPFTVVKPLQIPLEYLHVAKPLSPEEKTRRAIAEDNVEERLQNMDPERKVALFLHDVLPLIGSDISAADDPWEVLFNLSKHMKSIVTHFQSNEAEVEKVRSEMAKLRQEMNNKVVLEKSRCSVDSCDVYKKEIEELKLQNKRDLRCRKELEEVVVQQQEQLEEMKKNKELKQLHDEVAELVKELTKQEHVEKASQQELLEQIRIAHYSTISSYEQKLTEVKDRLSNMVHSHEQREMEDLLNLVEKRLNEPRDEETFDDEPVSPFIPNLRIPDDLDRSSAADVSTARSSGRAVISTSISSNNLAKRANQKDYDEIFQSLVDTREAYFRDLRDISRRLDHFVEGHYQSEHAAVMDQVLDEPISTREKLNGLIDDQLKALETLFNSLVGTNRTLSNNLETAKGELNEWNTRVADAIGSTPNLLDVTIDILKKTQNPLRERLTQLSNELTQRDKDMKALFTRVTAITGKIGELVVSESGDANDGYYQITKSNIVELILQALCVIQDRELDLKEQLSKAEKAHKMISEELYTIEARLRYLADERVDSEMTEEQLIERLQRYLDIVTAPCFSDQYIPTADIDTMFAGAVPEGMTKPQEYLPIICESYKEMKAIIEQTKSFITASDGVFATLDGHNCDQAQLSVIQSNVNALHHGLSTLSGATTSSPVFVALSRFIMLIQTLVSMLGVEYGTPTILL